MFLGCYDVVDANSNLISALMIFVLTVQGNVVRLLTVLLEGTWLTLGHLTWNMISAV